MGKKDRIIVLGGGISGLACARELKQRGHDVLVVEARERVGGRLKGEPLLVTNQVVVPIDIGGALIHGIDQNPVFSVAKQMGVPLIPISDYCLLLDQNGWPFDPKEDEKISALFNECLDHTFARIQQQPEDSNNNNFGDLFDQVCQEKGVSPDNPLLKWHQANLELPTGAGFHDLGYTWNDDEPYGFTGDHAAIQTSWKFVMDKLAEGLDVLYESPVDKIQIVLQDGTVYAPSSTTTLPSDKEKKDTTSHEETTLPPPPPTPPTTTTTTTTTISSVLQSSPTRFSRRIRGDDASVRRSSRANKGKIDILQILDHHSICYDDPTKKLTSGRRRRNGDDTSKSTTMVQLTLTNGTVLEANALVCTLPLGILKIPPNQPGHVRFEPPLPNAKQLAISKLGCGLLNKCAISFPNVFWQDSDFLGLAGTEHSYLVLNAMNYTQEQHPILIFMFGGGFAKEVESWTDANIVKDCLGILKKICGKEVPNPIDYCVTRWGQEKYSRMAFTYIPPRVDGGRELTSMGEAIHDPVEPEKPLIMFAGEHTTPYHPSTMHGAFLSGVREAYRYDLYLNPSLNDNIKFESTEMMYEHTFPTRRSYKATANASNNNAKKQTPVSSMGVTAGPSLDGVIRSRRRRFAGMALRKQPKQVEPIQMSEPEKKTPPQTPTNGSRRSQRSTTTSAKKKNTLELAESPSNEENDVDMEKEKTATINALEDRILLRSLQSYGRDTALVRAKVVPVFGSKRKRKADQIRSRWQQLKGTSSATTNRSTTASWKKWVAKQVAISNSDGATEAQDQDLQQRRSKRGRIIAPRNGIL